ncbi:MAG: hypothetical protein ACRD1T_06315, partial [Acidimicrobiia bacterium]
MSFCVFRTTALALAALTITASLTSVSASPREERLARLATKYKQTHQRLLLQGKQARIQRARALAALKGKARLPEARRKAPLDLGEPGGPQGTEPRGDASLERGAMPANVSALLPNVRVNNPALDAANSTQAEVLIAALGNYILVAWNDGQGFVNPAPNNDTQGVGYST